MADKIISQYAGGDGSLDRLLANPQDWIVPTFTERTDDGQFENIHTVVVSLVTGKKAEKHSAVYTTFIPKGLSQADELNWLVRGGFKFLQNFTDAPNLTEKENKVVSILQKSYEENDWYRFIVKPQSMDRVMYVFGMDKSCLKSERKKHDVSKKQVEDGFVEWATDCVHQMNQKLKEAGLVRGNEVLSQEKCKQENPFGIEWKN